MHSLQEAAQAIPIVELEIAHGVIAIARAKALVVITATLIFAKVQHFRAEAHWLKVGAVSVCFDFISVGRINIRDV